MFALFSSVVSYRASEYTVREEFIRYFLQHKLCVYIGSIFTREIFLVCQILNTVATSKDSKEAIQRIRRQSSVREVRPLSFKLIAVYLDTLYLKKNLINRNFHFE